MLLLFSLLLDSCLSFVTRDPLHHKQQKQISQLQARGVELLNYSYFYQKVDHFDPTNTLYFKQRYLINDEYYDDSHILLYYLNGESALGRTTAQGGYHSGLILDTL